MDPMIGMVFMIPWNWAPMNYQLCQGQLVTVQQYEALYSLMGFVFGGNGSSNFNLPNLQGRTPIGTGILNASQYTLGAAGGAQVTTLSQTNLPAHIHGTSFVPAIGPQVVTIPGTVGTLSVTADLPVSTAAATTAAPALTNGQSAYLANAAAGTAGNALKGLYTTSAPAVGATATLPATTTISGTPSTSATNVTINAVTGGSVSIAPAGSSAPFPNMQPYLAMSFVIAMNGLYPDRP